jgi:hypothetical protein
MFLRTSAAFLPSALREASILAVSASISATALFWSSMIFLHLASFSAAVAAAAAFAFSSASSLIAFLALISSVILLLSFAAATSGESFFSSFLRMIFDSASIFFSIALFFSSSFFWTWTDSACSADA